MKLLFVISKYYPKVGGTPNCTRNLIEQIKKHHSVHVLTTMDRVDDEKTTLLDDVIIHKRLSYDHIAMTSLTNDKGLSFLKRIWAIASKTFFRVIPLDPFFKRVRFSRAINKLQKKEHFDWVVAVSGDIIPPLSVLKCKGLKNKCFYQLDPYTTNAMLPKEKAASRLELEKRIHSSFDLVITTKMISDELSSRFELGENVVVCNFPNISDRTSVVESKKDELRCVFCGAMYAARNMDRTLEIMDAVTKFDQSIYFDFYILGDTSAARKAASKNENICVFDPVTPNEIFDVMKKHQALVNIGNVMTNQVPSKIYDYISTGLPIINILCNEDCPTIPVLEKYPLSLNLSPNDTVDEAAKKILAHLRETNGKRVDYSLIANEFYENTISCVKERMISNMMRIGESKC